MTLATSADSGDVCIAMAPTVSLGTSVDAAGAEIKTESVRVRVCVVLVSLVVRHERVSYSVYQTE